MNFNCQPDFRRKGSSAGLTRLPVGQAALKARSRGRKRVLKLTNGAIEALGAGQQFVAFGLHKSGTPYRWVNGSPTDTRRDSLRVTTEAQLDALSRALDDAGLLVSDTGSHRHRTSETSLSKINGQALAPLVGLDCRPAIVPAGMAARMAAGLSTNQNFTAGVPDDARTLLVTRLGLEKDAQITRSSKFSDDLGADCLDIVEIIMAFEEEFKVEIAIDVDCMRSRRLPNITVGDLLDAVAKGRR